jgi:hypothetical protein
LYLDSGRRTKSSHLGSLSPFQRQATSAASQCQDGRSCVARGVRNTPRSHSRYGMTGLERGNNTTRSVTSFTAAATKAPTRTTRTKTLRVPFFVRGFFPHCRCWQHDDAAVVGTKRLDRPWWPLFSRVVASLVVFVLTTD